MAQARSAWHAKIRIGPSPTALNGTQSHLLLGQLRDTGLFFQQMSKASRGEGPCARSHSLEQSPGSRDSNPELFLLCHHSRGSGACPLPSRQPGARQGRSAEEGRRDRAVWGPSGLAGAATGWRTRGLDEDGQRGKSLQQHSWTHLPRHRVALVCLAGLPRVSFAAPSSSLIPSSGPWAGPHIPSSSLT